MKRLRSQLIGVAQESVLLFADYENGGPMWTGEGDREIRRRVTFPEPFRSVPTVTVGMSLLDSDKDANLRAHVLAENVARRGFEIVFRTWNDSRIARICVDWMAIGEVEDDDYWDVL